MKPATVIWRIFVAFLLVTTAQAQPVIQWQAAFGGSLSDVLNALQQTSDGGYILGGTSSSTVSGNKTNTAFGFVDYWVVKLNASGNKLWEKSFGGTGADSLRCLQQTSDGGYILGGQSASPVSGNKTNAGFGDDDYWVVKLDPNGNKVWDKSFGGSSNETFSALQQTIDNGFILGGFSYSPASGNKTDAGFGGSDYWVVKLDSNGNKLWEKSFGTSSYESLNSLQQTTDGGYLLGGTAPPDVSGNKTNAGFGGSDFWVIKLDTDGNKLWERSYGGEAGDALTALQKTSDGNYILGGHSISPVSGNKTNIGHGDYDFWLVKVDADGNKLWDKTFGGSAAEFLTSLQQTSDGGYLLGGHSSSSVSGNKSTPSFGLNDQWLVKVDANGNKLWDKSYGGNTNDFLRSLRQTTDGGYIIGGESFSGVTGNKTSTNFGLMDYWVVKLVEPPSIKSLTADGNSVILSCQGTVGINYALDRALNLTPPIVWSPQKTNPMGASGVLLFTNTLIADTNNFWRLRSLP